ncbi:response regulator [Romeria aff. gracilis LEGE 07310]|uniref:Probable transcriptional regulator ycf27 n=1 Tax=Vasconcelosia minhoensis LEGE 07310 TaxID=915328 RepID=A0A8J7AR05_9CYAN|nr:response regulator [Romeria gracilis]MBE9078999.1 response regulator [Romeria aff. gracilis LEGE 07310]
MSQSRAVILIAEDDDRVRDTLERSLAAAGFAVITAADGQEALKRFQQAEIVDLIILDILMPRLDGFQVCQLLRQVSDVPIIMATVLNSASDRVTGLELGANDYVVKPYSTKELIARIRSILRRMPRRGSIAPAASFERPNMIEVGPLTLDSVTRKLYRGSRYIRLTEVEFRLLELLVGEPGHIFSRSEILQRIWGYEANSLVDTKTVDVHISRLRVKLKDDTQSPQFIVTIRGRGYMFLVQR